MKRATVRLTALDGREVRSLVLLAQGAYDANSRSAAFDGVVISNVPTDRVETYTIADGGNAWLLDIEQFSAPICLFQPKEA